MGKNQKINCTVHSCEYNNPEYKLCNLDAIIVEPCSKCNTGKPLEESMCGSYKKTKY